jgi:protoporphyrinogen oxidase
MRTDNQLSRRLFLRQSGGSLLAGSVAAASVGLSACDGPNPWDRVVVTIDRPGFKLGHQMRELSYPQKIDTSQRCQVLVVGSGVAGLTAVWNLQRQGVKDIVLLDGPEFMGNAASHRFATGQVGPTGSHYLPLPSIESRHVREILKEMGVFSGQIGASRPSYDESVLVHAPSERLLRAAQWESSLVPHLGLDATATAQQNQFFELTKQLSNTTGQDGKRIFVVPIALASRDPTWLTLDNVNFKAWLDQMKFSDPSLLWYLDYCCRDEFGSGIEQVSAWAGLHYFASRAGHASNAEDGAVLTWPDGLATVARFLADGFKGRRLSASALALRRNNEGAQVIALNHASGAQFAIQASTVVLATPLHITARIDPEIGLAFADWRTQLPIHVPWVVANFQMRRRPSEKSGAGLSWDNVVYDSPALGFVNASQQLIRVDEFAAPTLTSYCALNTAPADQARQWCANASDEELIEVAAQDLVHAYGPRFWRHVQAVHVTVRAHGMPSPWPGFLHKPLLNQLRQPLGRVWYANADLSGYSVFEEASWWGTRVEL